MIYYAHSMRIYGTKQEERELKYLRKVFKNVVDPKKIKPGEGDNYMKPYLDKVKKCDMVVVTRLHNGCIGKGAYEEITVAMSNRIPVVLFDIDEVPPVFMQVESVKLASNHKKDWVNYAFIEKWNIA